MSDDLPPVKKIPSSWTASDRSIRAVQVIFELEQAESRALRMRALERDLSPSDYIRDIVGLPRKKPIRPRLSISLSEEDYQILAKRYGLQPEQKDRIRALIKDELVRAHRS